MSEMVTNVVGSVALTPKSRLDITRVRTNATARPITTPFQRKFHTLTAPQHYQISGHEYVLGPNHELSGLVRAGWSRVVINIIQMPPWHPWWHDVHPVFHRELDDARI